MGSRSLAALDAIEPEGEREEDKPDAGRQRGEVLHFVNWAH